MPKFTVIIGGSFGAGNYGMCGRAYCPRFLWMWPNARISVMGGEQGQRALATVRRDGIESRGGTWSAEEGRLPQAILEQYEHQGIRTSRPRACGTTASSIRRRGACWRWRSASLNAPIPEPVRGLQDVTYNVPDVRNIVHIMPPTS